MQATGTAGLGSRVWSLGIVALGLVGLATGTFDPGQAAPTWLPERTLLAYLANSFLVLAGAAVHWRRTTDAAAAALTAYYGIVVVLLMDGRIIVSHPTVFSSYSNSAEQLAIAATGLIICCSRARRQAERTARLARLGQVAFALCAALFGVAHFVYLNLTAPLVPRWLPPSQAFWAFATGAAQIAGAAAILARTRARLAAVLLTVMYAAFTPLVHLPMLLGSPRDIFIWSENALNIALVGAAWVVADSLRSRHSVARS